MSKHQLLDNVSHHDLKINTARSKKYGDNVSSVLTFPEEFRNIQAHYPICFIKNPQNSSGFDAIALLGFEKTENLFLTDEGWHAAYIPLMIQRAPFLLGMPEGSDHNNTQAKVYFDTTSPRVNTETGESVFLKHGGQSPYLRRMADMLDCIHSGLQSSKMFFKLLEDYDLIEPFSLNVSLQDGSSNQLEGLYTINEDKLNTLPSNILQSIQKDGWLATIYMVIASLSNLRTLIHYKNKRQN